MNGESGGDEKLAPVIPLFGTGAVRSRSRDGSNAPSGASPDASPDAQSVASTGASTEVEPGVSGREPVVPRRTGEVGLWRSTWDDDASGDTRDPGPSDRHPARGAANRGARGPAGGDAIGTPYGSDGRTDSEGAGSSDRAGSARGRLRALRPHEMPRGGDASSTEPDPHPDPAEAAEAASEALVRKLRARSLSVAEATTFLRGLQIASDQIDRIIDEFSARRYLDDIMLAGHLVTSGHERKGQGRLALARVLAQRGIPRDVADEALAELPDDDTERALEFARSKARSMGRLDPETAKRRLSGQLARRGYPGGVVTQVVRQVLSEQRLATRTSGVRFEDS